jgi:hypothetical protein
MKKKGVVKKAGLVILAAFFALCAFAFAACGEWTYKTAGTYGVGGDIPAGEYVLVSDIQSEDDAVNTWHYQVQTKRQPASVSEVLYGNTGYFRTYIKVEAGQYLKFNGGPNPGQGVKLYRSEDAPEIVKNADGSYNGGQYKVGVDIEAGAYSLMVRENQLFIGGQITKTPYAASGSSDFIGFLFGKQINITLQAGTYNFDGAVMTKA